MDHCDECGFAYDSVDVTEVPTAIRAFGKRYTAPLTRFLPGEDGGSILRAHPFDDVWSALEYACHMRDVLQVQRERVARALVEETPTVEPMGRDERVTLHRYNEQDPSTVAGELAEAADALAGDFEAFTPDQWERTVVYGYPEPATRTLAWVARHTVHEGQHHLLDIGRVLRAARGR